MTGTGTAMGHVRTGFRTTFTVNRADFGMTADAPPLIGNDVQVIVAIEAIKQ